MKLRGYQGKIKKDAKIVSNDPQGARLALTVQGTVKSFVDIRPTDSIAFRGTSEKMSESVVELTSVSHPFQITKTETNLEGKIRYDMETVEAGRHYRLKVTNLMQQGNYAGYIRCATDLEQKPEILIRVNGAIQGDIDVKPKTILLGNLAAQQPTRLGKVIVASWGNKPFKISKLTYDTSLLEVTQQSVPGQNGYYLELKPKMENVPPGNQKLTVLSVETDATPGSPQDVQVHVINSTQTSPLGVGGTGSNAPSRDQQAPQPPGPSQ